MTKSQGEITLASFVSKGWLLKSKYVLYHSGMRKSSKLNTLFDRRGRYSLSTRALLELLPYLKTTYPDEILECTICMEVIYDLQHLGSAGFIFLRF
jgi:non-structural maintenance of chromosomes element 1